MKTPFLTYPALFAFAATLLPSASAEDSLEKCLTAVTENLATSLAESRESSSQTAFVRIAVANFTDLDGAETKLGKLVAEDLSIHFVSEGKRGIRVIDRANLQRLLQEHKLGASGLVDPVTAKKLGKIAGIDVFVLGTLTENQGQFQITAKAIDSETAEIRAATRGSFQAGENYQGLFRELPMNATAGDTRQEAARSYAPKRIAPLQVQPLSIQLVEGTTGHNLLVTVSLTNESTNPVRVFLGHGQYEQYYYNAPQQDYPKQKLNGRAVTPTGATFQLSKVDGLKQSNQDDGGKGYFRGINRYTEIQARKSSTVTLLYSRHGFFKSEEKPNSATFNFELRIVGEDDQTQAVHFPGLSF